MTQGIPRRTSTASDQSHALSAYLDELLCPDGFDDVSPGTAVELAAPIPAIQQGQDFAASIADTGAMKIAVPVQAIDAVLEFSNEAMVVESSAAWITGEYRYQQRNIKLVDCEVLMNSNKQHNEHKTLILILKNTQWGLLCLSVEQQVPIENGLVRWRDDLSNKPWLTATIQQYHCALLEPLVFSNWLDQGTEPE